MAKYKITGIVEYSILTRDVNKKFENASFYGNPVCKVEHKDRSFEYSPTPELFKDDTIESFVWHIIWNRKDNIALDELNKKEM